MARFTILGDCRAEYLDPLIKSLNYTEATINTVFEREVGILGLISMAYARAKSRPQDTVIICPGVRDMLNVDNHTGESTLRYLTVENMTDHITALLNEGDVNFNVAYPTSHIIFAPMTGVDLKCYAMTNDNDGHHQYVIDASITRINDNIVAINERNHVPTPWTAGKVHRYRKSKSGRVRYTQKYYHLHDGYHPGPDLLKFWAFALISAVWHCT